MLAAMLLMSMGAFAQSNEPLEGDVNNDGKVDVADIVKIIDIMQNSETPVEETKYYWYVGFEDQSSVDTNNIKTSPTEIGWHNFTTGTTSLHVGEVSNDTKVYWFVLVPADSGLVNVRDAGEVLGGYTNSTITVDNVSYIKITQNTATKKFDYDITT